MEVKTCLRQQTRDRFSLWRGERTKTIDSSFVTAGEGCGDSSRVWNWERFIENRLAKRCAPPCTSHSTSRLLLIKFTRLSHKERLHLERITKPQTWPVSPSSQPPLRLRPPNTPPPTGASAQGRLRDVAPARAAPSHRAPLCRATPGKEQRVGELPRPCPGEAEGPRAHGPAALDLPPQPPPPEAAPRTRPPARARASRHLYEAWNREAQKQSRPAAPEAPSRQRPPPRRPPRAHLHAGRAPPPHAAPSGTRHAPADTWRLDGLLHTHLRRRGRKRPASPRRRREVTSGATPWNPEGRRRGAELPGRLEGNQDPGRALPPAGTGLSAGSRPPPRPSGPVAEEDWRTSRRRWRLATWASSTPAVAAVDARNRPRDGLKETGSLRGYPSARVGSGALGLSVGRTPPLPNSCAA
ncbi:hypothetical protein VULLAG_LOCUS7871 [Vulpes lagopus]